MAKNVTKVAKIVTEVAQQKNVNKVAKNVTKVVKNVTLWTLWPNLAVIDPNSFGFVKVILCCKKQKQK